MIKVGIIDYGMGNIWSVRTALEFLGVLPKIVSVSSEINEFSHLIIPGVGSFKKAMDNIHELQMFNPIVTQAQSEKCKILGICLGMQLLCSDSEEGGFTKGFGLVNSSVKKFKIKNKNLKVPHIGFNSVVMDKTEGLFSGLLRPSDFYFVHSYRITEMPDKANLCYCEYGEKFVAGFEFKNIFGTQFHPEKSQTNGLKLLQNFLLSS